jgi:triacylglycerol lipase
MSLLTKLPRERYRPDAFVDFRPVPEFIEINGRAMAWMSQLAYETDDPEKIAEILDDWDLQTVPDGIVAAEVNSVLPIASTRAIVATGRGATVVAFAGTDPLVLANWITDFDIRMSASGVAEGFGLAAEAVWPKLSALIGRRSEAARPVLVTGHSLGGALAALIAHRIMGQNVADVAAVYTFGSPRPGNEEFAAGYNDLLGARSFRLVHGEDLVPTVAPSFLGFRHVGRRLHCERGGRFSAGTLAVDATSDEPLFVQGIATEVFGVLRHPFESALAMTERLGLAFQMASGRGPDTMRSDAAGALIETLPPRLRDHMPDRYIGAFG